MRYLFYRCLEGYADRSHRESLVNRPKYAVFVPEGSDEGKQTDKEPIGIYIGMSKNNVCPRYYDSHPVDFVCEHINDQLPVGCSPFSYIRIRVDDRLDIAGDVLSVSTLVM